MMKKWLFQPFVYVAGGKALIIGIVGMIVPAIIAYFSRTHFDGVLDLHIGAQTPAYIYAVEPLINWLSATIAFFAGGYFFSTTRPRLIDIAGTMAMSRCALIPAVVVAFLQPADMSVTNIPPIAWFVILVTIITTIWYVALMYQAFTISANMKGSKAVLVFLGSLIVAEIISKIALSPFYNHLN